jgi:anti-sigma regulatory factor (Ser/Thr protein kinase)
MKRKFLFSSDTCQLAAVRSAVREFFDACGMPESDSAVLVLAIDEACTNVIRHAYHHECRPIRLNMQQTKSALRIVIRDYGKSCEPEKIRSRPLTEIRPGGVGVHIIREAFDEVTYTPKLRGTELVLVKYFKRPVAPKADEG